MAPRVVFLHTVTTLAGLFTNLSKELLPADLEVIHIADELLLKSVLAQGGLSPLIHRRVAEHAIAAEEAGAAAFQCTCSSISPCVDTVRPLVGIPVLKIDDPMVDEALRLRNPNSCGCHSADYVETNQRAGSYSGSGFGLFRSG